ncbi:phosphoribosylformylglycinamidine cyclo-ligase [Clostridium pasteurianum DSM 525 = ATCC 6013]|uniref:Phosphoribosylformylglycinamidine cyclo-ligase n=1 Tax=Clostridium pasteurianum DSM 525 = ATCC 6013 TaxID=1262449 RepID=A0A0H3J4W3_CLOPA|nr:phosphoribosylformylglycinamidine cyclo-ligase [Clostridium pasteurianum]AJA48544.1 phosphoribosylformylglycinamidine cyclo-ligase [Clostridium pasteurianum DSM 525 = ATCC 6013]AJA52532.1 phosphoribosylformylglycinamidine cyclo-ligase [Clostridium pasteurianum DSM 525 = ATCC 6013]AOZ75780.1 phosphoribosylaminoimidazole synthetase [Clostridium pasteurianum DSM 525 = ATCC 6013]AOZ79576.1 phosphoribosylaminoimidazole synthetase [Clostridium pasteurianum]ELP57975.1 phosphoribosylaminoimidazole 
MVTYKDAGVNIEEGYETVSKIKNYAKKTYSKNVLNNLGSFAGMFALGNYKNPVLVSGTDGVGTKLAIAFKLKKYDTVGIDCVAMCVNDILCHGAKPLFFLDYMACGKLESETASQIVKGVSEGCLQAESALIGGETAEMPGFYKDGDYDLAGFSVGIVEKDEIIDGSKIQDKDVLIGISSSGVHSNGFSLVRKLVPDMDIDFNGKKVGEVLLEPTKIYVKPVLKLMEKFEIRGMAHITGGGFHENIPRMFKGDFQAVINKDSYELPEIFKYLMSLGVKEEDMYNTFNMGIGFVLCVKEEDKDAVINELKEFGEKAFEIGYVKAGGNGVCIK